MSRTLREPLPSRLSTNPEGVADPGPANLASAEFLDQGVQLTAHPVKRPFYGFQPGQQAVRRHIVKLELFFIDLGRATGDDYVAKCDALVADEDAARSGDELGNLMLRLEAKRAVLRVVRGFGGVAHEASPLSGQS